MKEKQIKNVGNEIAKENEKERKSAVCFLVFCFLFCCFFVLFVVVFSLGWLAGWLRLSCYSGCQFPAIPLPPEEHTADYVILPPQERIRPIKFWPLWLNDRDWFDLIGLIGCVYSLSVCLFTAVLSYPSVLSFYYSTILLFYY